MQRPALRYRVSATTTFGLAVIWMMLWGDLSISAALWGIAIAILIQVLFPLPEIPEMETFHPIGFLRLILATLGGLVWASFIVAAQVLQFWKPMPGAIIRAPLRSDSVFIAAITAELVTLVPGSVAIDADEGGLLLHVFDASSERSVQRARDEVARTEAHVLRAFGTKEQRRLLEEG